MLKVEKTNIKFSYFVRMAMNVGNVIAKEIDKYVVLLNIKSMRFHSIEKQDEVILTYEGGTKVIVSLYNASRSEYEDWVVLGVKALFYGEKKNVKVERDWSILELKELQKKWCRPDAVDPSTIEGEISVFWNNGEECGYVEANPDSNQDGYYTKMDTFWYPMFDIEKKKEALKKAHEVLNK